MYEVERRMMRKMTCLMLNANITQEMMKKWVGFPIFCLVFIGRVAHTQQGPLEVAGTDLTDYCTYSSSGIP